MVTIGVDEISNIICERIEQYNREVKIVNTGTVLQVGDGIARIHGLDEAIADELVEFEEGTIGIALNLESNSVGIELMGDGLMIQEGSSVKAIGRIACRVRVYSNEAICLGDNVDTPIVNGDSHQSSNTYKTLVG